ncbi:PREDICTED: multidrug resistance-associated protein 4-like [Rhagoletis zephyria]|uniref:multidrug resistance-associated protein 4-like n=1 Tax=Rhagoletis zephyria TaxID=28612 RepID=UPI000811A18E|nr:PREDICTED: multidrug resistance-associated protein 4-like [Rhagoletis zephyria]
MHNLTLFHDMRLGMRAKVAASSLLYQKLLKLSQSSMASTSSAQLINFLSTDLGRLDDFCCIAPHLVIAPLQTIAILTILWSYLGTAATLVGFSLLLALIPLQSFTGKLSGQFRAKTATQTDTRLKLTTEIIASMRSVKAFNWEGPLGKRIFDARSNEIKALSNGTFLKAINISIFFTAYRVVCFACLVVYVLHGEQSTLLTPEVIFVSLALLNRLRLTTTNCLPSAIAMTAELLVTCRRIQAFLLLDEVEKEKATENQLAQSEKFKVKAEHVTAKWSQTKSTVLNNVSFSLKRGELLAVIGPVGSGKSSLLFGLLGELPLISGSLKMAKNTLSYASQEAFIVFDSVRNNILFGETYQAERYQTVIMACALQRDIEELPEGDQTMVGIGENQSSKGTVVQLSGGQRARVALARAVYRQADVYLLDDSLSAVDAPVAQHIFQKCILELLNGKTTILVTHQLQFLEQTNKILFLDDKNPDIPAFVGSYNELQRSGKLKDVLQTIGKNSNNKTEKETSKRSPIYSHLSTTLNGLTSIRAFRKENRWSEQFTSYLNDHSALWFFYLASSRAMALFVDWAVILYVVAITTTVMTSEVITGSEAGLAITSGLTLTGMIQWLIKNFADLEGQMNSVERVVVYQVLEQEQEKSSIQKIVLEKEWPSEGSIKVENLKLFYNNNPVLRNINFSIYGGEKVGIVGRTSAGKSSLVGALLQLYTPEKGSVISIDGVDTTKIDLNLLRKSISIIDQRPVLFSGSVRFNLDPFGVHSEDRIWAALKSVELAKKIQSFNFKEKLDQEVSLTFFSAGELQLLQLARAILEQNKILLLDEATSNVDMQTDALVQKTIRKHFFNCTVLTVAHRLSTIIDCDRVMVLEAGQIVEFDAPSTLLKRGGLFAKMCQKTGENMYEHLRKQAEI